MNVRLFFIFGLALATGACVPFLFPGCTTVIPVIGKPEIRGTQTHNETHNHYTMPPGISPEDFTDFVRKNDEILHERNASRAGQGGWLSTWRARFWIAVIVLCVLLLLGVPVFSWLWRAWGAAKKYTRQVVAGVNDMLNTMDKDSMEKAKIVLRGRQDEDTQTAVKKLRTEVPTGQPASGNANGKIGFHVNL